MQFDHDSSYVTFMAGSFRHLLVDGKAWSIPIVWLVLLPHCCAHCRARLERTGTVRQGKKVQHGAEAFTDIISLIIVLSPE